jgi:hypothetical protein
MYDGCCHLLVVDLHSHILKGFFSIPGIAYRWGANISVLKAFPISTRHSPHNDYNMTPYMVSNKMAFAASAGIIWEGENKNGSTHKKYKGNVENRAQRQKRTL